MRRKAGADGEEKRSTRAGPFARAVDRLAARLVAAALVLLAAPLAGCLDATVAGCDGVGEPIASATGRLTPANETLELSVPYDGNGSGLAAALTWAGNVTEGGVDLRTPEDPGATSTVRKTSGNRTCRGWGGLEEGTYTIEAFYHGDADEPGQRPPQAEPPSPIHVEVQVHVKR